MQRPLPEYVRIFWSQKVVLWCLLVVAHPWAAHADNGATLMDPFEDSPTMGSSIRQQDLLWQSTVKGYLVDPALRSKSPQTNSLRTSENTRATRPAAQPAKTIAQPEKSPKTPPSPSPFHKWISPRGASTAKTKAEKPPAAIRPLDEISSVPTTDDVDESESSTEPNRTVDGPVFVRPHQARA